MVDSESFAFKSSDSIIYDISASIVGTMKGTALNGKVFSNVPGFKYRG